MNLELVKAESCGFAGIYYSALVFPISLLFTTGAVIYYSVYFKSDDLQQQPYPLTPIKSTINHQPYYMGRLYILLLTLIFFH